MSSLIDLVRFRELEPGDYNCVLSDWAKSWKGSPWAGTVRNDRFHQTTKDTIDSLIARGALVVIATTDDDRDQILGWSCFERSVGGVSVLHYVFVKEDFRGEGIAPALIALTGDGQRIYTHRTRDSKYLSELGDHVPAIARRKELEPVNVKSKTRKRRIPRPRNPEQGQGLALERQDLPRD